MTTSLKDKTATEGGRCLPLQKTAGVNIARKLGLKYPLKALPVAVAGSP